MNGDEEVFPFDNKKVELEKEVTVFCTEDVITVANALVVDAIVFESGEGYMSGFDGYACSFCCGCKVVKSKDFRHDLDCPVLVAQDLLTGCDL